MLMTKIRRLFTLLFPRTLWSRRYAVVWAGSFATILAFDLLWSFATSFRGLGFVQTYLYAVLAASVMSLAAFSRHRWPTALVLVGASLLSLANLMYCRTYFMPIPPASYALGGNVAEFGDSIRHSLIIYDIVFAIIPLLTLLLMGKDNGLNRRPALKAWSVTVITVAAIALTVGVCTRMPLAHIEHLKGECYYRATPPVVYTLPLSVMADALESNRPVSDAEIADAQAYLDEHRKLTDTMPIDTVANPRRNLVLIFVESLESWPLGASVENQEITPNLNRLIAGHRPVWIARHITSQAGPGRSIDGQLLMTAGLRPLSDYVYSMRFPDREYPHIAKELRRDRQAVSYLLSGDRSTTWNQGAMSRRFGFDKVMFREAWDSSESFGHPRNPSDGSFLHQVAEAMKSGKIWPVGQTAYVQIITYSSHFPFVIPPEHRKITLRDDYPEYLAEYITAINYTDSALGTFIDYILSRPDADSTMIAIVGDHEGLASWRSDIRKSSAKAAALVDAESYVPMILINSPVSDQHNDIMGQVDVYPTLLQMSGCYNNASFRGLGFPALIRPLDADSKNRMQMLTAGQEKASSTIIRADMLRQCKTAHDTKKL